MTVITAATIAVATEAEVPISDAERWSPGSPFLYDLAVEPSSTPGAALDTLTGRLGARGVTWGTDADGVDLLLLNGRPMLLPMLLDQWFWPDGVHLDGEEPLRIDVNGSTRLGLNPFHNHVKVQPQWRGSACRSGHRHRCRVGCVNAGEGADAEMPTVRSERPVHGSPRSHSHQAPVLAASHAPPGQLATTGGV